MGHLKPTYEELEQRCQSAEAALAAIRSGQTDTVIGDQGALVLRLAEAEASLSKSEALLKEAQRIGHTGYMELTLPEQAVTCSEELYRIFELPPGGLPISQQVIRSLISEEDRARLIRLDQEAFASQSDLDYEYRLNLPGGKQRWVHHQTQVTYDADGKPVRMVAIIQDVTERKQAEEAVRQSQQRYQALFEDSPIAIWEEDFSLVKAEFERLRQSGVIDFRAYWHAHPEELNALAGWIRIKEINEASVRILRAENKDQVTKHLSDYFTEESMRVFKEEMVALAEGQTQFRSEIPLLNSRGEPVIFNLSLNVQPDCEDTLARVLVSFEDVTDRKQAEIKLSEHAARLETAEQVAGFGSWEFDPLSGAGWWSKQMYRLLGFNISEETPHFDAYLEHIHPQDRQLIRRQLEEMVHSQEPAPQEYRTNPAYGPERYLVTTVRVIRNSDNLPIKYIGTLMDIDERKRAEIARAAALEALQTERYWLRMMIDNLPDLIFVKDRDSRFIIANETTARFMGADSPDQLIGRTDADFYPADLAAEFIAREQHLIRSGGELSGWDRPQLDAAHNEHWLSAIKLPLRDTHGQIVGLVGIERDITDRKRAEAQRAELAERLELAMHAAHVGIWDWNVLKDEVVWAAENYALYGVQPGGFGSAYQAWLNGLHPEDRAANEELTQQALRGEREYRTEFRVVWPDGAVHWLQSNAQVYRDEHGKPVRLIGVNYDITDRKQAESSLRKSEAKFHALFDNFPMQGVIYRFIRAAQGEIVDWEISDINPRGAISIGGTPRDLIGKRALDLFGEDVMAPYLATSRQIAASGQAQLFETHFESNGRDYLSSVFLVGPDHYANISVDITDRKRAEEKLQRSEALLAEAQRIGHIGHLEWNAPDHHVFLSDELCRIFQIPQNLAGISRQAVDALVLPADRERLRKLDAELFATQSDLDYDFRVNLPAGRICWIHQITKVTYGANGKPVHMLGVLQDITERKQAELAQHESEARFRSIFESTNAIMFLIEPDSGQIVEANAAAAHFYGYTREQLASMNIAEINQLPPDQVRAERQEAKRNARSSFIFPHRLASGQIRTVEVRSHPITSDGQVLLFSIVYDITEKVENERKLRESQLRMEMALKGANVATWDWNVQTGETVFNERWSEIVGYTLQELEPISIQTWAELCHPDDLKVSEKLLQQHFAGETEYYECEARMKHKNGSWVWVIDRGKVMEWRADGQPLRMFGTHLDITERKHEEHYTKARLRLANLSFQTLDMETLMRSMLDEAETLTDSQIGFFHFVDDDQNTISLQAWSTNTLRTLCTAEGKGQHYPVAQAGIWADGIRDGEPRIYNDYGSVPHRRELPEGHAPITRLITLPIKRNNLIVAAMGVGNKPRAYDPHDLSVVQRLAEEAFDIVLRKRAEHALHESREKYRSLLESLDSVIAMIDTEGRFLYLNERAAQELGGRPDQFIGRTMTDLFPEPVASQQLLAIQDVIRADRPSAVTNESVVQGQRRWYRSSIQPIHDGTGRAVQALINTSDITPIIQAQRVLEDLNRTLEERVAQRTAQLEAANKELEAFSYSISHDLRAPLRAIAGFSRILDEDYGAQLDEQAQHYLQLVCTNAQQMGHLIDDLLAFSRITRQSVDKHPVDMNELVQQVLDGLRPAEADRAIELTVADLPPCQADRALLKQVWINLLSNALKYTSKRTPARIDIGCQQEHDQLIYFVRDNGAGFNMQYADKLFGVFQRLHRAQEYEGTGVGLAIVKRIVERHGGRIWAEAAVEQGATFYFTLGD
jgi:PAS domain S-box-containing protein